MFPKIFVICALASLCHGGHLGQYSHGSQGSGVSSQSFIMDHGHQSYDDHLYNHHTEENAYPRYEFKYTVSDDQTGDEKSHAENRDGDAVEGEYSLVQPDGKTRTVTYTADKQNGFQAEVRYTGGNDQYQDIHQFNQQHHHY